jgi:hypothetical protein
LDDRRFDSLVKSLAAGTSRRSMLKGLLGFGGAVAASGIAERTAEAARRGSTPTPTPIICPGTQIASNGVCICLGALSKCGSDCCNPSGIGAAHSECCDGACCFGTCSTEETCCPYPSAYCEAHDLCCGGDENACCGAEGCCATSCCPDASGAALCCEGDTPKCCSGDTCIPESGCCSDAECSGCESCVGNVCIDDQTKCAGCQSCRDGSCVDDQEKCFGCERCLDGACVVDHSECLVECKRTSCEPGGICLISIDDDCNYGVDCCANAEGVDECHPGVCNSDGTCSAPFDCSGQDACCADYPVPNQCFRPICSQYGTCAFVTDCNGDDSCCQGMALPCQKGVCNPDGTCSNEFFCTSDACCQSFEIDPPCTVRTCDTSTGTCNVTTSCLLSPGCCNGLTDACHIGLCGMDGQCHQVDHCQENADCCPDGFGCAPNGECQFCGPGLTILGCI